MSGLCSVAWFEERSTGPSWTHQRVVTVVSAGAALRLVRELEGRGCRQVRWWHG